MADFFSLTKLHNYGKMIMLFAHSKILLLPNCSLETSPSVFSLYS